MSEAQYRLAVHVLEIILEKLKKKRPKKPFFSDAFTSEALSGIAQVSILVEIEAKDHASTIDEEQPS
jgi:hypothetical protein